MSSHPFDFLHLPGGATFIFTPCPGTKSESLKASLNTLKNAGADAIVTMLPTSEMTDLAVENLGLEAKSLELQWFQLPVEDDCSPETDFVTAFAKAKVALVVPG